MHTEVEDTVHKVGRHLLELEGIRPELHEHLQPPRALLAQALAINHLMKQSEILLGSALAHASRMSNRDALSLMLVAAEEAARLLLDIPGNLSSKRFRSKIENLGSLLLALAHRSAIAEALASPTRDHGHLRQAS